MPTEKSNLFEEIFTMGLNCGEKRCGECRSCYKEKYLALLKNQRETQSKLIDEIESAVDEAYKNNSAQPPYASIFRKFRYR